MTRRTPAASWIGLALLAAVLTQPSAGATPFDATVAGEVKVTVKYTGKGSVDGSHQLWIWLFDTPDIGPGAIPIAEMSLAKNGTTATFPDVAPEKVWIAVAYDEQGGFGGSAPPPTGSPVMIYGMESGSPTPVSPGPKGEATVTFDDSQRMP
jgi:hypothetical protein